MQSAFSSLHPLDSSPSTWSESEWRRKRRRRGVGGDEAKKKRGGGAESHGGASISWRMTQKHIHAHTLAHMAFLLSVTHTASALRSCRCVFGFHTHQSRSNERKKNWAKRGKKKQKKKQEVAQGLVEWQKSRHSKGRIQRKFRKKKRNRSGTQQTLFPNLPFTLEKRGWIQKKKKKRKHSTKKEKKLKRGRGFDTLQ